MNKVSKTLGLVLGLGLMLLAYAGPGDNSLVIGASQEPEALENFANNQAIRAEIWGYMFPGLVRVNLEGEPQPIVATEIPSEENGRVQVFMDDEGNPESMTVRWTIREEAVYSDGTPIETDSVALSFEIYSNPNVPIASRTIFNTITDLNIIDEKNFEITYAPINLFYQIDQGFSQGGPFDHPAHIWGPIWEGVQARIADASPEQATEIIRNEFLGHPFATTQQGPPVSYGAFQFVEWIPGASLTMERNPLFWIEPEGGAENYIQTVEYRFIQNTPTLLVNVISGTIDALSSVGLSSDQLPTLQSAAIGGGFEAYAVAGSVWEHIDINQFESSAPSMDLTLGDPRTRQALAHAMNRQGLIEELFQGAVVPSFVFVNNSSPLYNADLPRYEYDPEQASALLADVGWQPGSDGVLERTTDDGRTVRFEIEYVTVAGRADRERNQQYLCDNLRDVGIVCRINNAPSSVVFDNAFIARGSTGQSWTGMFEFAWVSNPLLERGLLFNCSSVPTAENGFSGNNVGGWCNEDFDALFSAAQQELNPEARRELFLEMQEIWAAELPAIPLYQDATVMSVRSGLVNYTFSGPTQYPNWNAWEIGWEQNGAVERVVQPERLQ